MKNTFFYFILFPFLGFINAIRNYRSSWAKSTIIAFVAFFAMSMVKSEDVDSSRYVDKLKEMYAGNKSFETLKDSFYNESDGQPDIYAGLVTYLFSLFTDNGNLLFLFFGFVFGFFYVNNIWLVLGESIGKLPWEQFLLLATFSMVIGFWNITGVRMWTAAHVFFYGAFLYLYHNKKKGLFIAILSILIHFSLILPVGLVIIYSLFRLNFRILYIFYIASFFIAELNIDFIRTNLETYMPEFILPRVKGYLNDEHIEIVNDVLTGANWYIVYYQKFLTYFTLIFISVLFLKADMSKTIKKLLGFSLMFLAVANITSMLPSGVRFLNIALLFSIATSFIVVSKTKQVLIIKSVKFLSPLLIIFCIVSIRTSLDFFNITTLTNPIVVFFTDINLPIIEFIK